MPLAAKGHPPKVSIWLGKGKEFTKYIAVRSSMAAGIWLLKLHVVTPADAPASTDVFKQPGPKVLFTGVPKAVRRKVPSGSGPTVV